MIKTYPEAIAELGTNMWLEYQTDARLAMEIVAYIYGKSLSEVQADLDAFIKQS